MPKSPDTGEIILESGTQTEAELQDTGEQIAEYGEARRPVPGESSQAENGQPGAADREVEAGKPRITRDWSKDVPAGVQRRFDRLTADRRAAEERAAAAERRIAELEGRSPRTEPAERTQNGAQRTDQTRQQRKATEAPADPKLSEAHNQRLAAARSKFNDWNEVFSRAAKDNIVVPTVAYREMQQLDNGGELEYYIARDPSIASAMLAAVNAGKPDQAVNIVRQLSQKLYVQSLDGYRDHQARIAEAAKKPEFQQARQAAANITIPRAVAPAIVAMENSADVVSYLARNPNVAEELNHMPEHVAIARIGRISAALEGNSHRGSQSRVPAPITPVNTSGSNTPQSLADLAATNPDEFLRRRNRDDPHGRTRR